MKKCLAMLFAALIAAGMLSFGAMGEGEPELPATEETTAEPAETVTPVEETVPEPATEEPAAGENEAAAAFSGRLFAKLVNTDPICVGDEVKFRASVSDANMDYEIFWQRWDTTEAEPEWENVKKGVVYTFTADEKTPLYRYRAVALAADLTELTYSYLTVTLSERDEEAPEEAAAATEETPETTEETPEVTEEAAEEAGEAPETAAEETPEIPEEPRTIVLENNGEETFEDLNVREDSDGLSAIFTTLPEGAEVTVLAVEGDWVKVEVDGEVGYVYIDDLTAYLDTQKEEDEPETVNPQTPKAEKKVTIFSSRRATMEMGEPVVLTSRLEGFEGCEIRYTWTCDKHDGQGFQPVPGANGATYSFSATAESLSWDWQLKVQSRPAQN